MRNPPAHRNNILPILIGGFLCLACVAIGVIAWNRITRPFRPPPVVTSAATFIPSDASIESPITPLETATLTVPPTPMISPTAVDLPVKEDFSSEYSGLWTVIGDAVVADHGVNPFFRGILTGPPESPVSMYIGNVAWHDYEISMRMADLTGYDMTLGVRVKDRSNMVAFECHKGSCGWNVIQDGQQRTLLQNQNMVFGENFSMTVRGNKFSGIGDNPGGMYTSSFILPDQYQGKFDGGGVYLFFKNAEIDYFYINPLP